MKKYKKILFFTVLLIHFSSCVSVQKHNLQIEKKHTVKELRADINKIYIQLQKLHPKLYQYTPKKTMDFKFDSLKKTIDKPMNSKSFYKIIAPVVSQFRHGHIGVYPPSKKYTKKQKRIKKKQNFEFNELDFEYLQDKLYVSKTRGAGNFFIGAEVLKVENEKISHLIKKYKKQISSDGYNTTFYNRFLGHRFKNLYRRDKGFKDSITITLKVKDSVFSSVFKHLLVKKKRHNYATPKFTKKEKRKYNKIHGYNSVGKNYNRSIIFFKDSSIAYMKIRRFSKGNYKKFYKRSFEKMTTANTKNLIIDLRFNGGGRVFEIKNLYSYLTNKEFVFFNESEVKSRTPILNFATANTSSKALKFGSILLSPFLVTFDYINTKKREGKLYYNFLTKPQKPNPLNFKGNIYVIINGYSFSASATLSAHLQANNRAILVGEETGGAYNETVAGLFKIYKLPNTKLKLRIGLANLKLPFKQEPDGFGVKPHVKIIPTIKDRRLRKDPELEWILKDIKSKIEPY